MVSRVNTKSAAPRAPRTAAAAQFTPVEELKTESADTESLYQRMRDSVNEYMAAMSMPSWTRQAVSIALGLITYGTVFYGLMQLVDALCFAVMAYSGIGFISFMTAFLGILVAIVAATSAGKWVYDVALVFEWSNVKSRVSSFFKTKELAHA